MKKLFFFLPFFLFCFGLKCNNLDYSSILENCETFSINLKNFLNWSYIDEEEVVGWIGLGPTRDLKGLPDGNVKFKGIPFYIYSHRKNNKKCAISLGYSYQIPVLKFPMRVGPIPVNKKVDYLFFLHSAAWVRGTKGLPVGKYIINYDAKNNIKKEIILKKGFQIDDWIVAGSVKLEDGEVAWKKDLSKSKRKGGIYIFMWKNPFPDIPVKSIVIEGNKNAQLIILAITGATKK